MLIWTASTSVKTNPKWDSSAVQRWSWYSLGAHRWPWQSHGAHPWPAMVQRWSIADMKTFRKKTRSSWEMTCSWGECQTKQHDRLDPAHIFCPITKFWSTSQKVEKLEYCSNFQKFSTNNKFTTDFCNFWYYRLIKSPKQSTKLEVIFSITFWKFWEKPLQVILPPISAYESPNAGNIFRNKFIE